MKRRAGRVLTVAGAPQATRLPVVINRNLADRLWPGRPAVGRVLRSSAGPPAYEVIGLIDGIRHWRLDAEPGPDVYLPYDAVAAWDLGLLDIAIRHDGRADGLATAVRNAFIELDDQLPLDRIVSMQSRISGSIATPGFYAALLTCFALLAFMLAAGGVYSSMLYVVGLRRRELGIRAALGAARGDLLRLVVTRGAFLVFLGTLSGLAATLVLARLVESLTYGVSARDPTTLAVAAALLAAAGLAACWVPARRAARADPARTLRAG